MPQPKAREADDDTTDDLPRETGPVDEAASDDATDDDFDAEQLEPEGDSHTWLEDDAVVGIDVPGEPIDALEGESAMDDATLAIDDDPLDLDPESTWTEDSEAEGALFVGELLEDDDAMAAGADDGAEGLPDETADLPDVAAGEAAGEDGDELADDLMVSEGTAALGARTFPFLDELTVAIASFEGELVQVTPRALHVGAQSIAIELEAGESLAGATALDAEHLLVWSSAGRAQVLAVFSQRAVPIEGVVRRAFADGLGGAWLLGDDGAISHRPSAPRADGLGDPRSLGVVPRAFELVGTRLAPDVLYVLVRDGEGAGLCTLEGGVITPRALPRLPTALAVDDDARVLVAMGERVALLDALPSALAEPSENEAAAPITGMCTVDRALVVLADARASLRERS